MSSYMNAHYIYKDTVYDSMQELIAVMVKDEVAAELKKHNIQIIKEINDDSNL